LTNETISRQLELSRLISDLAKKSLRQMGRALGDAAPEAEISSFTELIEVRLISRLESVFDQKKVFLLPVSAQGHEPKRTDTDESADERDMTEKEGHADGEPEPALILGHPPNAKLPEYVFMLPILLALEQEMSLTQDTEAQRGYPHQ
jgi:hypothetical protein